MTVVILLSILNTFCLAICCGCFLRIRFDCNYLIREKRNQLDLVERCMKKVVTREDIKGYMDKICEDVHSLNEMKEQFSKEKWKKYHTVFGGKEGVSSK